jgi:hypothetical protein
LRDLFRLGNISFIMPTDAVTAAFFEHHDANRQLMLISLRRPPSHKTADISRCCRPRRAAANFLFKVALDDLQLT